MGFFCLLLLAGCQKKTEGLSMESLPELSKVQEETSEEASLDTSSTEEEQTSDSAEEEESSGAFTTITVAEGSYFITILEDLSEAGIIESPEAGLRMMEELPLAEFPLLSGIQNLEDRAFLAEGYIAPGSYTLPLEDPQKALKTLLHSYEAFWTEEMIQQAKDQGYTVDEIMIMASIVEFESSKDPTGEVKPQVAAVVRNRVEMPMALEMDVTVFYLEEALEPYRDPEDYSAVYDTYETADLPAGPIDSPSEASILAVLSPAETEDLFFIYDAEGNYYFAADYETHLYNCEMYLY